LVVAVVLDEPMIGRYGGDLAGPVFRRIAERTLRYLGVTPSASLAKFTPVKREVDSAEAAKPVIPAGGAGPPPAGSVRVPDATGMPAHDVVVAIGKAGLVPQIEGSGTVVRQSPAAGSSAPKGSSVRVVLEPAS
jgi:cell division protein FtsI (penicillin-binding protein 3)